MKLRLMATLIGFAVVGGLAGGVVMALWTGSQTASGSINATSGSADLHICEPNPAPSNPDCGNDDSGQDETIFEGLENLTPGDEVFGDMRLRNTGGNGWYVLAATTTVTEVSDPGNDCDMVPTTQIWLRGKYLTGLGWDPCNNNVSSTASNPPSGELQAFNWYA